MQTKIESYTKNKTHVFGILIVVFFLTLLSFYPSINNGFTNWDDNKYVTENKGLAQNKMTDYFLKDKFVASNFHPLTMISLTIDYSFAKLNPKQYHIVNLVFHLLNVILVFAFIYLLTGFWQSASLVALLFGIHPMHVESVAWISERKDVLYTFFYFSTLLTYTYYTKLKSYSRIYIYILTIFLFLLSLLSKAQAVTLPLILFIIDYYLNRKYNWKSLFEKLPFFILSITFGIIAIYAQQTNARAMVHNDTFINNIFYASYGLLSYVFKLFFPFNLSCIYNYPLKENGILPLEFYIAPFLVIGLFVWIYFKWRNNKNIVFGALFFLLNIAPLLQFIKVGNSIISDRYSYVSYVGLFFILGNIFMLAINNLNKKNKTNNSKIFSKYSGLIVTFFMVILVIFSFASNQRCRVWKNSETLWNNVIENYPDVAISYNNLAAIYIDNAEKNIVNNNSNFAQTLLQKSISLCEKATQLEPGNASAYNDLGAAYFKLGKYDNAIINYQKTISLNPIQNSAWIGISMSKEFLGKHDSALIFINKAISLSPTNADLYFTRGNIYSYQLLFAKAIPDYNKVIVQNPTNLGVYNNLASCYNQVEKYDSAIILYNKCLELNQEVWKAYIGKGIALFGLKNYKESIKNLDLGISLNNNDPYPFFIRSKAYLELNNKAAALKDAMEAKRLGMTIPEDYLKQIEFELQ